MLSWDGANLDAARGGRGERQRAWARHLPPMLCGAICLAARKLWANLPPPKELALKLTYGGKGSAVQPAENLAAAHYVLAGVLTAEGPAYAWYHKNELAAGTTRGNAPAHSPGCSATSQYPVRSDWVPMAGAEAIEPGSAVLNKHASLLAKVHGWLELADSPPGASTGDYYSLALIPSSSETPLAVDQAAHQGDELKLALTSSQRVLDRRWVYVLDIDCHGQGTVLYPRGNAENQFPNDAGSGRQFLLPGAPVLRVGAPYGVDSLILLSTAQPLSDPYALNFEGVASRGTHAGASPLEKLLNQTSAGTRGFSSEVPSNWGIGITTVHSIPRDVAK